MTPTPQANVLAPTERAQMASNVRTRDPRGGTLVGIAVAVVLIALLAAGAFSILRTGDAGPTASTTDLVAADAMTFEMTTTSSGELEAVRQIEVRSMVETRTTILEIVPEGTFAAEGDVLVRLNGDDVVKRIDEELARVNSAKADLVSARESLAIQQSENDSSLRKGELEVVLKELELRRWEEGELRTKTKDYRRALEKAEAEEVRLKEKAERSRELFSEGFISSDELKQHERDYADAIATLEKAALEEETYHEFVKPKDRRQKESDVAEAKAELERTKRQNASRLASQEADLANKQQQLSIRERTLAKLRQQLEATTVRAPAEGLVVYGTTGGRRPWDNDGPLQVGTEIRPNQTMIVLPDTTRMVAQVRVHESLAGRIRVGQAATVSVDAVRGRTFPGTVTAKGVLAEQGGWRDPNLREYTVSIELDSDNADGELKPSMRCEAQIRLGRVEDALAIPVQSVFSEGLVRYVFTESDGRFTRRPVKVGRRSDRFAEILAGLEPGERVLIREPLARERVDRGWDASELARVGLALADDGSVIRAERPRGSARMPASTPGTDPLSRR